MKIALVCSAGGHLAQLHWLEPWWTDHERFWVTFDKPDARARLRDERVEWAAFPTTRNLPNLARNSLLAARVLRRERPDVVISNGAAVALPFFVVARSLGIKTVWMEVMDRIDTPSLTGRLVRPLADRVVLQWESQKRHYPEGIVLGPPA